MQLGKMMIFVSDSAKAKHFYCEVLGFPLQSENNSRLEFTHDGVGFVAFKCEKDSLIEDYGNIARSVFVFNVESVEKTMNDLRLKGVDFIHTIPAENDFSRYAAFKDPFGNIHEIFEQK